MEVRVFPLLGGAEYADGPVVIIDVLRAFSTAAFVFAQGAKEMFVVEHLQEAFALKEKNPGFVLMGKSSACRFRGSISGIRPRKFSDGIFRAKQPYFERPQALLE